MPPSAAPEWLRVGCSLETTPTSAPYRVASMAARIPARPAPTTTTSCRTINASGNRGGPSSRQRTKPGRRVALLATVLGVSWIRARLRGMAVLSPFPGGTLAKMAFALPAARHVHRNLSQHELLDRTHQMPNSRSTDYGAPNVQTQVLARSKASTFIVADDPPAEPHQAIDRDEWERISAAQDAYIAEQEMIVVDGYIGNAPDTARPGPRSTSRPRTSTSPACRTSCTSTMPRRRRRLRSRAGRHLHAQPRRWPSYPDDRLIAVNLDLNVTRVFNSDYFGESKKGGLRMWNKLVHDRGGLALHAGCKVIPTPRGDRVGLIVGLSGTGKTTTTFTRQNGSLPVQDDFVAWWPDGTVARDRGRLLRQDLRAQPEGRADDLRRGHQAERVPRERQPERRPATSTSSTRATPRTAAPSSRSPRSRRPTRRSSSRPTSC